MKHLLNGALLAGLALGLVYATVAFGAVSVEYATPLYAIAAILALLWAAKLLLWKQLSWLRSPMHSGVAAFALYAVARYLTSPVEYDSRLELFHVALYTLIYFVVFAVWAWRARAIAPRVALGALAVLLVVAGVGYSNSTVRARVAHTVGVRETDQSVVLKDVTLAGRTLMWKATLRMIPEHPLFGTGPLTWE